MGEDIDWLDRASDWWATLTAEKQVNATVNQTGVVAAQTHLMECQLQEAVKQREATVFVARATLAMVFATFILAIVTVLK